MDAAYLPPQRETRQVYGVYLQQNRNDVKIDASLFQNIVTADKTVGKAVISHPAFNSSRCPGAFGSAH